MPAEAASAPSAEAPGTATPGNGDGPWRQLAPVLGAIGTGLGVLGFVTFVGGAIEYARLSTAGLPAEEAVANIPTSELVVVGATNLVPALIIALAATAAFYVWHVLSYGQRLVGELRAKESSEPKSDAKANALTESTATKSSSQQTGKCWE